MQFLILGANGYLGSYLYKRMLSERINVIGTGHRHGYTKGLVKFDVLRDSIQNITKWVNDRERTAIICIAQTDIDQCKTQYEQSYQINVVFTQKMVEALLQESFHIIIFSTDNVFDGLKGHYTEFDKTNAVNQYGRMKAEMESFLSRGYPNVCIFRLPKVLGTEREQQNLLTDLEGKLVGGESDALKTQECRLLQKKTYISLVLLLQGKNYVEYLIFPVAKYLVEKNWQKSSLGTWGVLKKKLLNWNWKSLLLKI